MDTNHPENASSQEVVDGVRITQLVAGSKMSVIYYQIDPGSELPEHSHHHEQSGYVLQGEAEFIVDGNSHEFSEGDTYLIPGDEPHRILNTGGDTLEGIDIFSPPRENW
jgi:quercetin dioxygenase-like cupin family protein